MRAGFSHTYAALPGHFYARTPPTPVAAPAIIAFNDELAVELGIDRASVPDEELAAFCTGNAIPDDAMPLAMAYAGHQFGSFVPQLGDGRALLIGEVVDHAGLRRDLQWKGAGPTPFSRRGDGRAALGPVLREYLVSEAMHALGIPTTRALSAATTGEHVLREDGPLPGAVLIRVAASHIRIGTFQYFAARGDTDGLRTLADYVIDRHYPDLRGAADPYFGLLQAVVARQCELITRWMQVGFIHGVMNTDNMTVSGETIDFGPCAFMDDYDPATVFSYIDRRGRYAYANQPAIMQWNLARFAETLLPLIDADPNVAVDRATAAVEEVPACYGQYWRRGFGRKLGLQDASADDTGLIEDLLQLMQADRADFTNTFRALGQAATEPTALPESFHPWREGWLARLRREPGGVEAARARLLQVNPAYIPRNHQVEAAIAAAVERADHAPFHLLRKVLSRAFDEQPEHAALRAPPRPEERVRNTFCGT